MTIGLIKILLRFLATAGLLAVLGGCEQPPVSDAAKPVLATVGERSIDWQEIWQSYHLQPKWGRGLTRAEAYRNQLAFLVEEKLFAQAAAAEGALSHPELQGHLRFVKEKEMIKALYRRHVEQKVVIDSSDYQAAYQYQKMHVKLAFCRTKDLQSAQRYAALLKTTPVDDITAIDAENDRLGVTPMFTFGDMAPELEAVAFNLKLDEVGGPVTVADQYVVVKLLDGYSEKFQSEYDFALQKNKIHKVIFERRANRISDRYVQSLLAGKQIRIQKAPFAVMTGHFNRLVENKSGQAPIPIHLDDRELRLASTELKDILDAPLVTFAGGQMSVGEFLEHLFNMPAGLRPKVNMAAPLRDAIFRTIRDRFLAAEAYREGLDQDPQVLQAAEQQGDAVLARFYMKLMRDAITVSAEDIERYRQTDAFATLAQQHGDNLTDDVLKSFVLDYRFKQQRMAVADSLSGIYPVTLDDEALLAQIPDAGEVITEKPISLYYLEDFR